MKSKMLASMLKEHQSRQHIRKELQEKRKKDATAAASALTHSLIDHLNAGVAQAYVNQKKLDTETKLLQVNTAQFAKQTMQWLRLVEDFNQSLKEIGDVENWARSIETDMHTISSALEYAYKVEKDANDRQNDSGERSSVSSTESSPVERSVSSTDSSPVERSLGRPAQHTD